MRIGQEPSCGPAARGAAAAAAVGRAVPPAAGRAADADRVTLSEAARVLAGLREAIGPLDDVRADRVDALRPVVAAGGYRVDASQVAYRFLNEELGGLIA